MPPESHTRFLRRILVVEDDEVVAGALSEGLHAEGFEVHLERTGDDAFFRLRRKVDGASPTPLIHTIRGVGFMVSDAEP